MKTRHKKKSNLKKIRSWFAKNLLFANEKKDNSTTKKRRRRSRKKRKVNLWENFKDIYVLNFKPKKNRRRRRKRSLHKRAFLHGNRFIQNTIANIGKLFS